MWTVNNIGSSRLSLLTEEIDGHDNTPDIFEQRSVSSSLIRVVADELSSTERNDFIIGLFGRYGQGKTKVVNEIIQNFDRRQINFQGRQRFTHCEIFQASNYSVEDLEDNFDFFLEGRRVMKIAILSLILLLFLFFVTLRLVDVLQIENRLQLTLLITLIGASLASLGSLIGSFRLLWRDFSRSLRIGHARAFFQARLRSYWHGPKVLVIDDLDRATPAQQNALLQSLRRHRGSLGAVVIVAFNDEPLKGGQALGLFEAEEVFQKTFDLQARLGPMTASDAAEMSTFFLEKLVSRNLSDAKTLDSSPTHLFLSPLIVGDFARILYLHGNASARFAKKMLNSIFFEADRLSLTSVHDVSALMRVHGLLTFFPNLESDLDFLSFALNSQSIDELIKTIETRLGTSLGLDRERSIRRYLTYTNHLRPSHGTWKRVLRIWRNVTEREDLTRGAVFTTEFLRNWAMCDALLVATDVDGDRQQIFDDLLETPFQHPGDRQLPRVPEFPNLSDETPVDSVLSDFWKFLVLRVHLYDISTTKSENDDFLDKISQYERLKLPTAPPIVARIDDRLWTSPAGIVEHHTKLTFHDLRLEDSLRECLSSVDYSLANQRKLSPNSRRLPAMIVPIKRAWPSLEKTDNFLIGKPEDHIDRLKEVLEIYRDTDYLMPNSIKNYFASRLGNDDEAFFLLKRLLFANSPNFWPSGTLRDGLEDTKFRAGFRKQILGNILDINTDLAVWLAANYLVVTRENDAELEERLDVFHSDHIDNNARVNSRWSQDIYAASQFSRYLSALSVKV